MATLPALGESYLSFDAEYAGELAIGTEDFLAGAIGQSVSIAPTIQGYGQWFDYDGQIELSFADGFSEVSIGLSRAQANLYPWEFLRLRFGAFSYRPGFGELVSPSSFFASQDIEALIENGGRGTTSQSLLGQVTLFAPIGFATLTVSSPFGTDTVLDPDSRWFPSASFPSMIPWPFPPYERTLRTIDLSETIGDESAVEDLSLGLEIGATLPYFDVSLTGYYGKDSQTAYSAEVIFPSDDINVFDIGLQPVASKGFAVGIDAAVPIGPLRIWTDSAWYEKRAFSTNRLSLTTFETRVDEAPAIETVNGASIELPRFGLTLLAEYRGVFALSSEESLLSPFLSSVASGSLQFRPLYTLRFDEVAAVSLKDSSMLFYTAVTFAPDDQLSFQLQAPFFFGSTTSEFGQFAGQYMVSWSANLKF